MLIITGSYPPHICGVGDYTCRLMNTDKGKEWHLYHSSIWGVSSFVKHIRAINKTKEHTLNLQYPTQGYGWSLVPHLLCVYYSWFTRKRFSVTLHEQSQLSLKARWAQKIILLTANRVIFTNTFERNYAIRRILCIKNRSTVIKIFSNISVSQPIKSVGERTIDVVNFGHIRPLKGLEFFIDTIANAKEPIKAIIAGQVPSGFEDYYKELEIKAKKANIGICLNLSDADVSELLNDAKIVYLPFPDGASERRGSLLASLANGAVVATTIGPFTSQELSLAVIDIDRIAISDILINEDLLKDKQQKAFEFMKAEMPQSWDEIAQQYNYFLK